MSVLARSLQLISLAAMATFFGGSIALYTETPTRAQTVEQRVTHLEVDAARTAGIASDIPRRLDQIEARMSLLEIREATIDSSISKIYGFGVGIGALISILQVFQILSSVRK